MAKLEDVMTPKINLTVLTSDPAAPATGIISVFRKNGKLYTIDENSNVVQVDLTDILTTKGDMLVYTGVGYARVPVGNDGQILVADSTKPLGIKWGNASKPIAFYIDSTLSADTSVMSIIAPCALTVKEIRLAVDVAPTGASIIIDIHKNGTTLYTTQANRPTIVASGTSATAVLCDVTAIALGDKITLDIDQVGSTVPGENLSVIMICEVA